MPLNWQAITSIKLMKEMGVYNASYKLGIVKRRKSKNIATWNFLELAIKGSSCNT